jgi:hypothetical protein
MTAHRALRQLTDRHPLPKGGGKRIRNFSPLPRGEGVPTVGTGEGSLARNVAEETRLKKSSFQTSGLLVAPARRDHSRCCAAGNWLSTDGITHPIIHECYVDGFVYLTILRFW